MTSSVQNVLFLGGNNSALTIMAEAILTRMGAGQFRAFSAGITAAPSLHPLAVETLTGHGVDLSHLAPKQIDLFRAPQAPRMDFIFTVCDSDDRLVDLYFPGQPISARWNLPNPQAMSGNLEAQRAAFEESYRLLVSRIKIFVTLPRMMKQRLWVGPMRGTVEPPRVAMH